MSPARSVGRMIGGLLLVQLVGLILPFVRLLPMTTPDFLENAARLGPQIRVAALLLLANGALALGIAVVMFSIVRQYGAGVALTLLALSILWIATQAADNVHLLSMVSLSQRYTEQGAAQPELFRTLGEIARTSRRWAHYTTLLMIEAWFFAFYGLLFRHALVPRALAGFGLVMVLAHAAGVTLPTFLGYGGIPALAVSLGLSHLGVAGWLLAKGLGRVEVGARRFEA